MKNVKKMLVFSLVLALASFANMSLASQGAYEMDVLPGDGNEIVFDGGTFSLPAGDATVKNANPQFQEVIDDYIRIDTSGDQSSFVAVGVDGGNNFPEVFDYFSTFDPATGAAVPLTVDIRFRNHDSTGELGFAQFFFEERLPSVSDGGNTGSQFFITLSEDSVLNQTTENDPPELVASGLPLGDGEWHVIRLAYAGRGSESVRMWLDETDLGDLPRRRNERGGARAFLRFGDTTGSARLNGTTDVDYIRWTDSLLGSDPISSPIPEPASLALLGAGVLLLARRRR